jgi:hypothetical protein
VRTNVGICVDFITGSRNVNLQTLPGVWPQAHERSFLSALRRVVLLSDLSCRGQNPTPAFEPDGANAAEANPVRLPGPRCTDTRTEIQFSVLISQYESHRAIRRQQNCDSPEAPSDYPVELASRNER